MTPSAVLIFAAKVKQFETNTSIEKHLKSAQKSLKSVPLTDNLVTPLKTAYDEIDAAIGELAHRNKLVKLADISDSGWAVVSEYESHQLASDSDDEKRILKAEARAARKAKEAKAKRSATRRFQPPTFTSTSIPVVANSTPNRTAQSTSRRPGVCYSCGKPGHWKSECFSTPRAWTSGTKAPETSKISTSIYLSNSVDASIGYRNELDYDKKFTTSTQILNKESNVEK